MNYEILLQAITAQQAMIHDTLLVLFPAAESDAVRKVSDGIVLMMQNMVADSKSTFECATSHVFDVIVNNLGHLHTNHSLDEVLALIDTTIETATNSADLAAMKMDGTAGVH